MKRHPVKTEPAQPELASFYHLGSGPLGDRACRGTACFVARHLRPERWREACAQKSRVYCLGKCHLSPSHTGEDARPAVRVHAPRAIVLERIAQGNARTLAAHGPYAALAQALRQPREELLQQVERSGLRGRGGAGFPTGRKLRAVASQPGDDKVVVANADEGDSGAYIDRILLEDDPHAVLEGLAIAAYAVGARTGYIYVRKEYPRAGERLREALAEAHGAGLLGERIQGSGFSFDVELVVGEGSYVCGEETALLNSIEGRRPVVRTRPPYPAQAGLFGRPTLVHNVETLANLPWIVRHGGAAYAALGIGRSRGTKVVSLNSLFRRPGLYEVELGMPVRTLVEELGGGLARGRSGACSSAGRWRASLPPHLLDTPLGFEELRAIGAAVGHGGVVAFDEHTSIAELVQHVFSFGAYESCGKCTPCRLGARRVRAALRAGARGRRRAPERAEGVARTSSPRCGGRACAATAPGSRSSPQSVLRYYREGARACFA